VVIIDSGRVVAEGSPGELKSCTGSDRIEVHVRVRAGVAPAAAALERLGLGEPSVDSGTRRLTLAAADGPAVLASVAAALVEAGVELDDLTLRRPTLDEVFLALTTAEGAPV
jgi:ABC-2 type transport system ATP-binding protein